MVSIDDPAGAPGTVEGPGGQRSALPPAGSGGRTPTPQAPVRIHSTVVLAEQRLRLDPAHHVGGGPRLRDGGRPSPHDPGFRPGGERRPWFACLADPQPVSESRPGPVSGWHRPAGPPVQ